MAGTGPLRHDLILAQLRHGRVCFPPLVSARAEAIETTIEGSVVKVKRQSPSQDLLGELFQPRECQRF